MNAEANLIKEGESTATFTYEGHLKNSEGIFSAEFIAYKTKDNKYIGIKHNKTAGSLTLYQQNRTTPWNNISDITEAIFVSANEVRAIGSWETMGIEAKNYRACQMNLTADTSGNLYALYRDKPSNRGSLVKYNKTSKSWGYIGGAQNVFGSSTINEVAVRVDSRGRIFATALINKKIAIRVYDQSAASPAWVDFGDGGLYVGGASTKDQSPSITIKDDIIYALYRGSDNRTRVVKRRTDGTDEWTLVGDKIFEGTGGGEGVSVPASTSMIIKKNGTIFVALSGRGISGGRQEPREVIVVQWNGTAWTQVGSGIGKGTDISINVSPVAQEVYIAYRDQPNATTTAPEGRATVRKWNGSSWELVGARYLSPESSDWIRMRFYSDDVPLVIYGGDGGTDSQSTTKGFYYNKTDRGWVKLGVSPNISPGLTYYTDGVVDGDDVFYVIYGARYVGSGSGAQLQIRKHNRVVPK